MTAEGTGYVPVAPLTTAQALASLDAGLVTDPDGAVPFPGYLPRTVEATRPRWRPPHGRKLTVCLLLHAPCYQDDVPPGTPDGVVRPVSMAGGVGRDTSEPRYGQLARLSQWDFGLTVGLWRLLDVAADLGVPAAVALDAHGVRGRAGLARLAASRAAEVVVRGSAANLLVGEGTTREQELAYVADARDAVAEATGTTPTGWFSPERSGSSRTPELLRESGFTWFGDWPVDDVPVALGGAARGLTAVPFAMETEDVFQLYRRGLPAAAFEQLLDDTVDQLLADADVVGPRLLGLGWFGWALGQACFADVAERVLRRLAHHPDVELTTPGALVAAGGIPEADDTLVPRGVR